MSEGENVVLRLEAKVGAASPRPPSWAIGHTELSAGVLGETAPAVAGRRRALGFEGGNVALLCSVSVHRVELRMADWNEV